MHSRARASKYPTFLVPLRNVRIWRRRREGDRAAVDAKPFWPMPTALASSLAAGLALDLVNFGSAPSSSFREPTKAAYP
jgi:hypothetical protein